jgi:hypothetical protein
VHRVPVPIFECPDSFLTVPRASGPVFMFCAPRLIFNGIECVGSHFDVLRAPTHFPRNRGRRVPFSCFALLDSFSALLRESGPFFMFCAPGLVLDGIEGDRSRFHALRARTRFRWYRGRRVPFSCFVLPDSFSAVPSASGPVFMFCAPRLLFGGTEGAGSSFHVLRFLTRFRWYRGCPVPFSCFPLPDLFFSGIEYVGSRFHVLCSMTRFRRCRMRRVPFSSFARPDSFSAVSRTSCPIFMFCAPGHIFGGAEVVGSRFHISSVLTSFRRYRGCRAPFSCFACPDTFSAEQSPSGPVFIFCAPELIFGGTDGVLSHFHVFRSRTCFRQYRVRRFSF